MADLADLLVAVDERAAGESGAFLVEEASGAIRGSVLVEDRRVCWAAIPGGAARLRYLLRHHAERSLADAELDEVIRVCQGAPRALGELLIERGIASDRGLGAALRRHIVESLIAQCGAAESAIRWLPHRRQGYGARHAFAPIGLLADAGALLHPGEVAQIDRDLAPDLAGDPTTEIAGSFAIGDDEEAVVVQARIDERGPGDLRVRDLLWLGSWAVAALGACDGFSAAVLRRGASSAPGRAALGWRAGRRLVHAATIDRPAELTRAIDALCDRRIPTVFTTSVPRPAPYEPRLKIRT